MGKNLALTKASGKTVKAEASKNLVEIKTVEQIVSQ